MTIDAEPSAYSEDYVRMEAHAQLIADNILDLSHSDYLHAPMFGSGSITRAKTNIVEENGCITARWTIERDLPLPVLASEMPNPEGLVDGSFETFWYPGGAMRVTVIQVPVDAPDRAISSNTAHLLTPESAGATHYFWRSCRNYRKDDIAYRDRMKAGLREIFLREDKPVIEAQQRVISQLDKAVSQRIDTAPGRARRVMQRMLAAEHASSAAPQAS